MQSVKTQPGVDCGSDHELLISKYRLKLKNIRKTTRPFRLTHEKTEKFNIPVTYTKIKSVIKSLLK